MLLRLLLFFNDFRGKFIHTNVPNSVHCTSLHRGGKGMCHVYIPAFSSSYTL